MALLDKNEVQDGSQSGKVENGEVKLTYKQHRKLKHKSYKAERAKEFAALEDKTVLVDRTRILDQDEVENQSL